MIVVDTSVLIDLFKGKKNEAVSKFLEIEALNADFCIPIYCCQELLQGAKDLKEWNLLLEFLETQTHISPLHGFSTYSAAAHIFYTCRRKGITIRSTIDCLIAQLVLEREGYRLLHNDADFREIAAHFPLQML